MLFFSFPIKLVRWFIYSLPQRSFACTMMHTFIVSVCRQTDRQTDKVKPITNIPPSPSQDLNGITITTNDIYTPTKLGGYIGFSLSVCLSVRLSVCLSVCQLTFRVRPVASTVQDGFFPYLVQMITSMRRCVACDELWPWPISSRSFDLDLENRVRSVTFSVLDRLFPYLPQIITTIRGCVVC